jgi:hypothetical protein
LAFGGWASFDTILPSILSFLGSIIDDEAMMIAVDAIGRVTVKEK